MTTFVYSIYADSGKRIRTESVSGDRIGPVLRRISESVVQQGGIDKVQIRVRAVRLDENSVIADSKRLGTIGALLQLATEHYTQEMDQIVENLHKIVSHPTKAKKLANVLIKWHKNQRVNELELPSLETGDTLLVGKFKNRKAQITGFETDDNNQPIANTTKGDQKIFKPRIAKLMPSQDR